MKMMGPKFAGPYSTPESFLVAFMDGPVDEVFVLLQLAGQQMHCPSAYPALVRSANNTCSLRNSNNDAQ
jgi:hypothetical protein